ncbi:hypothetical protein [Dechloromonas denitrificans]|uniref:hypothetical protein n=1 Tax=Dechloromonas denitrificans TaxID=281362 RepID=UPI001CF9F50A|nr:hypothetical protein [Dechloromonas denitrificans]UCV09143.1 hypothetical protein KI615_06340 [Dechloromonas denitrificans]
MIIPSFKLHGLGAATKALDRLERQTRYAMARALTKTAKDAQGELVGEMKNQFDRPTPWTLRSTFVKPATKQTLRAIVGVKDMAGAKARATPEAILYHQFRGGGRIWKGLERWLNRAGLIGSSEFVVPGAGARIDQYGNMSQGQVVQIMSQLKLGADASAWSSGSKRSRRSVRLAGRVFWSLGYGKASHLRRGAWIDMGGEIGLRPLLIVVRRTNYRARIDLTHIARRTIGRNWDDNFTAAFYEALASAR